MATLPAHLIDLNYASDSNKSELHKNADGSLSLTQVDFRGKKYALKFEGGAGTEAGAQQASPARCVTPGKRAAAMSCRAFLCACILGVL
ncbi:MAG TPA: hypothetical protein VGR50_01435 [Terriglobales bacterium]|nr:hypothetical protein [Terriglobales bacterium]